MRSPSSSPAAASFRSRPDARTRRPSPRWRRCAWSSRDRRSGHPRRCPSSTAGSFDRGCPSARRGRLHQRVPDLHQLLRILCARFHAHLRQRLELDTPNHTLTGVQLTPTAGKALSSIRVGKPDAMPVLLFWGATGVASSLVDAGESAVDASSVDAAADVGATSDATPPTADGGSGQSSLPSASPMVRGLAGVGRATEGTSSIRDRDEAGACLGNAAPCDCGIPREASVTSRGVSVPVLPPPAGATSHVCSRNATMFAISVAVKPIWNR